jgi:hypothetical protein
MTSDTNKTGLEQLVAKYGAPAPKAEVRKDTQKAFDASQVRTTAQADKTLKRVSEGVAEGQELAIQGQTELAKIQLELADLADEYGQLNVNFANALGKDAIYKIGDVMSLGWYSVLGKKDKVREIRFNAVNKKNDGLIILINKMSKLIEETHAKAEQGRTYSNQLQVENVTFLKDKDKDLIDRLKTGHYTFSDQAEAEKEIARLEGELKEFDGVLIKYEGEVKAAKAAGDVEQVKKLTDEMTQVLDMKHEVLDGRLAADGVASEIRREILDAAKGVESAKGAIGAAQMNYQAVNLLIDSMNELEIVYRYLMEDMIPVYQMQAKIAATTTGALKMRDIAQRNASISNRLMDTNVKLVKGLAALTFDLLQTQTYDLESIAKKREELKAYTTQLNKLKMDWAEGQTTIRENNSGGPAGAGYVTAK